MDYNLPTLPGIDWQKAYQYLPEKDIVLMVLEEICATADEQIGLILQYLEALEKNPGTETFRDYRIQVHSMKATLRSLGADLFEEALALEEAAREERAEPILQGTKGFTERYANLVREIAPLTAGPVSAAFQEDAFREMVLQVQAAMEDFDISMMQEVLKSIKEMDLPAEYKAGVNALAEGCRDLDSERVEAACKALLGEP